MRFTIAAALMLLGFNNASAQSSLSGTYSMPVSCLQCDSIVKTLKLECNTGCKSGKYTLKQFAYNDSMKQVQYNHSGEWYLLENVGDAKNDKASIMVLDVLGYLDTYPLFVVEKNGNLAELRDRNPERFPEDVSKGEMGLYVRKKGGHKLWVEKATSYKDDPYFHVYTKH
jgi:hypothetical protein